MTTKTGKSVLGSKTLWGALLTAIGITLNGAGVDISPEEMGKFQVFADHIVDIVGLIMVVWGRFTASKSITTVLPQARV